MRDIYFSLSNSPYFKICTVGWLWDAAMTCNTFSLILLGRYVFNLNTFLLLCKSNCFQHSHTQQQPCPWHSSRHPSRIRSPKIYLLTWLWCSTLETFWDVTIMYNWPHYKKNKIWFIIFPNLYYGSFHFIRSSSINEYVVKVSNTFA